MLKGLSSDLEIFAILTFFSSFKAFLHKSGFALSDVCYTERRGQIRATTIWKSLLVYMQDKNVMGEKPRIFALFGLSEAPVNPVWDRRTWFRPQYLRIPS